MKRLEGVFAPTVTPFTADEDLDVAGFRANVRGHIADGLSGVVLAGSTGEAALLTESERAQLVRLAREDVPRDKWLIVGCGGESTRITIERTRSAQAGGADAVLVVSPHYYTPAMTPSALRAHFTRVADESPLPVILYNIPKFAHFSLPPELVAELARHPNVIGLKDSSGQAEIIQGFLAAQGDAFTVLTGSGQNLQAHMRLGARGGIVAVADFAGALAVEVYAAVKAGETARATAAQATLAPMAVTIVGKLGVPGVKAAMDRVGRVGGRVRMPLQALDAAGMAEMASALGT